MKNQDDLMNLMNELIKNKPQTTKIQDLCQRLSIPYSGDQVELMSFILDSTHRMTKVNPIKMKKTAKKLNHETSQ